MEHGAATRLSSSARVPAIQGPVARVNCELCLAQYIECRYIACEVRHVGQDDRWAIKSIRLHHRSQDLRVVRVQRSTCDVHVAIVHRIQTNVLFALMQRHLVPLRVGHRVEDDHIHIPLTRNHVVYTAHASVVRPCIVADDPARWRNEGGLMSTQHICLLAGDVLQIRPHIIGGRRHPGRISTHREPCTQRLPQCIRRARRL